MYAETRPFNVTDRELKEYVVHGDYRPQMPKIIPKEVADLVRSCWQKDPLKRPEVKDMIEVCTNLLESI